MVPAVTPAAAIVDEVEIGEEIADAAGGPVVAGVVDVAVAAVVVVDATAAVVMVATAVTAAVAAATGKSLATDSRGFTQIEQK